MPNVIDIGKLKGDRISSLLRSLDERISLKHVHRRLQAVAKVLIVTTFVEDALRVLLTFSVQQQSMKIAGWENPALHSILPAMSFVVQFGGSLLIVLPKDGSRVPEFGCYVLLAWCMWHPFMYRQQTNWEFVLETCTIMGGLLVLLSAMQTSYHDARKADSVGKVLPVKTAAEGGGAPADATDSTLKAAQRNQAFGRVLITSVFIFYAFQKVHGYAKRLQQRTEEYDWVTPIGEAIVIIGGLYACSLIIIGMKSRWCALLLAVSMCVTDLYMHPFWLFMFSTRTFLMEGVAGMEGYEVDAFTMADHQRYFFFQTMSTVGALLLLMVHGPGTLSMDEQNGPLQIITTKGDA